MTYVPFLTIMREAVPARNRVFFFSRSPHVPLFNCFFGMVVSSVVVAEETFVFVRNSRRHGDDSFRCSLFDLSDSSIFHTCVVEWR